MRDVQRFFFALPRFIYSLNTAASSGFQLGAVDFR